MRNLFTPRLNCELNTLMQSSAVALTNIPAGAFARILNTESTGTLLKNGADAGTVVSVMTGDSLQIETRTSVDPSTPLFVAYEIAGELGFFTTVTRSSTTPKQLVGYNGLIPLNLTDSQNSYSDEYGTSVSCVVSQYNSGDGAFIKTVPVLSEFKASGSAGLPFADYYSGLVAQLGPAGDVVGQTQVGMQPYKTVKALDLTWVTVSTEDRIVALDSNNKIVQTIPVGSRPMGIATYVDPSGVAHFYVCNYNGSSLTHITLGAEGATYTKETIPTAIARPLEVAVDAQGVLWITTSSALYRGVTDGSKWALTAIALGTGNTAPRGVIYNAVKDLIHVTVTNSNKLISIVPQTQVQSVISTPIGPYNMVLSETGVLFVVCFSSGLIQRVVDGVAKNTISVDPYPYNALYNSATGQLSVINYYGLPSQLQDQVGVGFGIADPATVPQLATIATTPFRVENIDTPTPIAVPKIYDAVILKNGTAVGQRTTVSSGDVVVLRFVTPHVSALNLDIPLFIGNQWESFKSITTVEDTDPDLQGFVLNDLNEQALNTVVTSNSFTVSGIDASAILQVATTIGTVVVNGVDSNATVADVKLNDVVAIRMLTPGAKNEERTATVTFGKASTTWLVQTLTQSVWWIRPDKKGLGPLDVPFNPTMLRKLIRRQLGGTRAEFDLGATPTGEDIRNKQYLYIPSFYEDCIYRVTTSGVVAEKKMLPEGSKPFAICLSPRVSRTPDLLASPLLTLAGANAVMNMNQPDALIPLSGSPRAIVASDDGTVVYVSLPDSHQIAVLTPLGLTYQVSKYISVGAVVEPYALALVKNKLYYSDRKSDMLGIIDNQVNTSTKIKVGFGVWDLELVASNSYLYTANSYDNTVSRVSLSYSNTVQTIAVGSVPSTLAYNTSNQTMYIGHYAQGELATIDHGRFESAAVMTQDIGGNFDASVATPDGLVYPQLYSNLAFGEGNPDLLTVETPMNKLVFVPQLDAERGTTVKSNEVTVSNVIRTMKLNVTSKGINAYRTYLNGTLVASQFTVVNGDRIRLELDVPDEMDVSMSITVSSYNVRSEWKVRSEGIRVMSPVIFDPIFGVKLRAMVTSNTVVVSGMSADAETTLQVLNSEWVEWTMYRNGVLVPRAETRLPNGLLEPTRVLAKNGDTIALYGISRGQYNSITEYFLLSEGEPVGKLVVHNVLLDGVDDIHVVHREEHYQPDASDDRVAQPLVQTLAVVDQAPLVAQPIPRQALAVVEGENTRTPVVVPRLTMALAEIAREYERAPAASVGIVVSDKTFDRGSPRAQEIIVESQKDVVQSYAATLVMVQQPGVDRVVPKAFILGPNKEYIYGEHEPGREAVEVKWERNRELSSVQAGPVDPKESTFDVMVPGRLTTVLFKYQRNRTPTPTIYAVQYERNPHYAVVQQDDAYDRLAIHNLVTWGPQLERHAIHAHVVWTPFVERNALHGNITWGPQVEARSVHEQITWIPVCERNALHAVVSPAPSVFEQRPNNPGRRPAAFVAEKAASRGAQVLADKPVYTAGVFGNMLATITLPLPTFAVHRKSIVEIERASPAEVQYGDPSYRAITTAKEQGLFDSPMQARQYANDMGFTEVDVVPVGIFWTWNTLPRRQNANCAVIADKYPMPHKWYVHGG